MKSAAVHAVLLVLMLAFAYQTWTRDTTSKPTTGSVVVWNDKATDLTAIVDENTEKTIKVEKKDGYWWGTETKVTKKAKPVPPPVGDAAPAAPEYDTSTTTTEFPVDGGAIVPLVSGWSSMRAIRNLGPLSDEQKDEYKLKDSDHNISIVFGDKSRSVVLGDHVLGGQDRYALDVDTGNGYVIAAALVTPLEGGQRSLQPKQVVPTGDDIQSIAIATPDGKSKTVSRMTVMDDNQKPVKTWGDKAANKADQTTANFLSKVETNAKPMKFDASIDVKTMTKLVTLTYSDASGKAIGTVDLYKRAGQAPPPPPAPADGGAAPPAPPAPVDYFVVSDLTRVPAQISKTAGDQIEQNIATVFTE
jgi:hypothetical protein